MRLWIEGRQRCEITQAWITSNATPVSYLNSEAAPETAPAASIRLVDTRPTKTGRSKADPTTLQSDTGVIARPNTPIPKSQRTVREDAKTATVLRQ